MLHEEERRGGEEEVGGGAVLDHSFPTAPGVLYIFYHPHKSMLGARKCCLYSPLVDYHCLAGLKREGVVREEVEPQSKKL